MNKPNKAKVLEVAVDRLVPGLYVDLGLSWTRHPFLFNSFKIKSADEIKVIKQLGLKAVAVDTDRSDTAIPEPREIPQAPEPKAQESETSETLWEEKNTRVEKAARFRRRRAKIAQQYSDTVKKVQRLTNELGTASANAMRDAGEVIDNIALSFDESSDVLLNLVNLSETGFTFYNHAINVTVLAMALGRALGLDTEQLRYLGMGAMLHDIGKTQLPYKVTMKNGPLTNAESKLLATHCAVGGKMARSVQKMRPETLAIIEQHHEFLDGSGYPLGLKGEEIHRFAQIVAIANLYDNLCNPPNAADALPPKAVMALLYKSYLHKLDPELVQRFISTMGVYPPGTVVRLSDDSIGLVTAVDNNAILKPQVLLYNPDIPQDEALAINLIEYDDLSVADVLKPGQYDKRIYHYLGIQQRIGYFVDPLGE